MEKTLKVVGGVLLFLIIIAVVVIVFKQGSLRNTFSEGPSNEAAVFESYSQLETKCRQVPSSFTAADQYDTEDDHYTCLPAKSELGQDELFVFIPGTGAKPVTHYKYITEYASKSGFHAIALRYPNDDAINTELCVGDATSDCHERIRQEIIYGKDVSDKVAVNSENSIIGRLQSTLSYLHRTYPNEGWDNYFDRKGDIDWSKVRVSGHSQGAGHATFLAKDFEVSRLVIFSWVDMYQGRLAPWLLKPFETPPEDTYLFWHVNDGMIANNQVRLAAALSVGALGLIVDVDTSNPPYNFTHRLTTNSDPRSELIPRDGIPGGISGLHGLNAHNTHIVDYATPIGENGEPIFGPTWQYLIGAEKAANARDRKTD